MTAADDSVPPSDETRRLSAEKAREQLLADPLLRDAPVVEGFKVLEPAVLYAKVGAGGMGAVYRGRHFKLDLDVAVKCLKPALLQEEGDFVKRFEREARLAASIAHQNVVRVMDVQERNGLHYLVMEFVRGETAAERVKRKGPLPEKEALAILYGVTAGLAAAHQKGIVHRDLKPENVMISLDGEVKLADLGLAKSQGGIDGRSISMAASQIMGTPQYMPPEQWETTDVTSAADIWALGATFFYLVTGRTGISGAGTWQAVMKRVTEQPYPLLRQERPDLRPEVHALFERCVQRLPQDRFADARALLRELKKLAIDDDDSVLLDPATGSLRDRQGLVTPPPRETVLKIKAIVQTEGAGRTTEPEPAAPRTPKSEDLTRRTPQPKRSRAGVWHFGLGVTALLAAAGASIAGLWPRDTTRDVYATPRASSDAGVYNATTSPLGPRIEVGAGIVMLRIEPKEFIMGSADPESGLGQEEAPHRVTISRPYWIAETEVTQAQWREVMQTAPWVGQSYTSVGDSHPATNVSWTDAVAFCDALTKREGAAGRLPPGHFYALPTEAEWEYACRGGSSGAYCYGDGEGRLSEFAVFGKEFKDTNGADCVRTKKPNAFGLYDMHGNVWEWCADWADYTDGKVVTDTYREGVTDPLSLRGALRVRRGGSWSNGPAGCRSPLRYAYAPSYADVHLGFRPALVARPPAK